MQGPRPVPRVSRKRVATSLLVDSSIGFINAMAAGVHNLESWTCSSIPSSLLALIHVTANISHIQGADIDALRPTALSG